MIFKPIRTNKSNRTCSRASSARSAPRRGAALRESLATRSAPLWMAGMGMGQPGGPWKKRGGTQKVFFFGGEMMENDD